MTDLNISTEVFNFTYLPDFADFILKNKMEEFVTVGIRFCREVNLPILKPISRFSEQELVVLSIETNKKMLEAIINRKIPEHIRQGIHSYTTNSIGYLDREDVLAEDLTMGFYLRRKIFAYFLDAYTKNMVTQKFIMNEVDIFTTQEELIAYRIYLKIQSDKAREVQKLYKLGQELNCFGNWVWDLASGKLQWSDEMYTIFNIDPHTNINFGNFVSAIPPADRDEVKHLLQKATAPGETAQYIFRIVTPRGEEKTIKGVSKIETSGHQLIKRCYGTCQDISNLIAV